MTVAEMLARMSSRELTAWMAFAQLEPFGGDTQYLGPAITSSVIANSKRKKGAKAMKVEDFMPQFNKKQQTVGEQMAIAQMYTAVSDSKDK